MLREPISLFVIGMAALGATVGVIHFDGPEWLACLPAPVVWFVQWRLTMISLARL